MHAWHEQRRNFKTNFQVNPNHPIWIQIDKDSTSVIIWIQINHGLIDPLDSNWPWFDKSNPPWIQINHYSINHTSRIQIDNDSINTSQLTHFSLFVFLNWP